MKVCKVFDFKNNKPLDDTWKQKIELEFELARFLRNVNVNTVEDAIENTDWEKEYPAIYNDDLDGELEQYAVRAFNDNRNFKHQIQIARYGWGIYNPLNRKRKTIDYTASQLWCLHVKGQPVYYLIIHRFADEKVVFVDAIWKSLYFSFHQYWDFMDVGVKAITLVAIAVMTIGTDKDFVIRKGETDGSNIMFDRAGIAKEPGNPPTNVELAMRNAGVKLWYSISQFQEEYKKYQCHVCDAISFQVCEHCMKTIYCSTKCQRKDFLQHK